MKHRHLSFLRQGWINFSKKNMVCTNSLTIPLKGFFGMLCLLYSVLGFT